MAKDDNQKKINDENATIESLDLPSMQFEIDVADIRILSPLAEGVEYIVYAGWYKKKPVALKVSQGSAVVDEDRGLFTREVEILKRVNHSNIVKFIGATTNNGPCMVIVLELVPNSYEVQEYLNSDLPKELDIVVTIALLVSRAMEYLHSQGIMHGNLYSGNILMAQHVVKLTGFSEAIEGIVDEEEAKEFRKHDVLAFGGLLLEIINGVTEDSQPPKNWYDIIKGVTDDSQPKNLNFKSAPSSQKDEILESLEELTEACSLEDPEDRPEFTMIRQNLESILRTIKVAGDLNSEIPSSTSREKMNKSMHDADRQVDDDLSGVQHQNTAESIGATPEAASPTSTELTEGLTLEEYIGAMSQLSI